MKKIYSYLLCLRCVSEIEDQRGPVALEERALDEPALKETTSREAKDEGGNSNRDVSVSFSFSFYTHMDFVIVIVYCCPLTFTC